MGAESSTMDLKIYLQRVITVANYENSKDAEVLRKQLFDQMDKNNDGAIDKKEIKIMWKCFESAYKKLASELDSKSLLTRTSFDQMTQYYDEEGEHDGVISYPEFCNILKETADRLLPHPK